MENREQQILSEIKSMMSSIRSQLERLDAKMAELQQVIDPEEFEVESVDIEIDIDPVVEPVAEVAVIQDDDLPFDDIPEEIQEEVHEAVAEEMPDEVQEEDDDLPVAEEPETLTVAEMAEEKAAPTINDMMAPEHAWKRDIPGTPVRDIRSAISLNDRVIFINLLFNENAQTFVDTLSRINAMETLDEVVGYISSEFPSWDMNSELVYRFMMAVRRKVR